MWNLAALAAKAQEAAARIERQLDDSVGLAASSTSTPNDAARGGGVVGGGGVATADNPNDDDDDEDDFFSDGHDDRNNRRNGAPRDVVVAAAAIDVGGIRGPMTSTSAVLDGGLKYGGEDDDDNDDDDRVGMVDGDGDGWDDADEIPLDDDDDHDDHDDNIGGGGTTTVEGAEDGIDGDGGEPTRTTTTTTTATTIATRGDDEDVSDARSPQGEINDDTYDDGNDDNDVANPPRGDDVIVPTSSIGPMVVTGDAICDAKPESDGDDDGSPLTVAPMASSSSVDVPTSSECDTNEERRRHLEEMTDLESRLRQRESQLASMSEMIASLSSQHESEVMEMRRIISETKDEAKRRITKSRERVEEMQGRLAEANRRADAAGGMEQGQSDLIAELRAEGEKLARKQGQMEQLVRTAKGEARDLEERLEAERSTREREASRADALEKEVKSLKDGLSAAKKGESQSKKLEGELLAAREESEKQRASNTVLDQQMKELREENKSLRREVQEARDGAALELEEELNKLRRERDGMLGDLEAKLRTSEREANVREDALRHEVSELRKRWQDAVRRAEDLSMDVQHSTAPLMRQLESTERQNRARAAAWAEVETKLRSDLEDHVVSLENVTKERNNLVSNDKRMQRLVKEKEGEVSSMRETIDRLNATIETLETRLEELEEGGEILKQELVIAERKASEGASKVRSEMMQTLVESEERYRSQIDALEEELDVERHGRGILEKQLDDLVESVSAAKFAQNHAGGGQRSPDKEKKLLSATDQASILQDTLATLAGFDSDVDDDDGKEVVHQRVQGQGGSFAAMEQLTLGLNGAKAEIDALRKQLVTSEESRASLLEELGVARQAMEKLPLFEQRVSELTMEIKLKDMEIQGLQDDIADVRYLYRTQLDALLEEKATTQSPIMQSDDDKRQNVIVINDDSN